MLLPRSLFALILCLTSSLRVTATVTIYTTLPKTTTVAPASASATPYSGYAAFNPTTIAAPAPPNPPQNGTIELQLWSGGMTGLSIPQRGNFLGLSVELSVSNEIIGKNASLLNVPFLNYLANIHVRAGAGPVLRVGGNSQETSTLFPAGLPDGAEIDKIKNNSTVGGVTQTPIVNFSPELLYVMKNVSALVSANWYFGLAFNDTSADGNTLLVAQYAQSILGSSLLALQLGNEPDLYGDHGRRPLNYSIPDYINDFAKVSGDIYNDPSVVNKATLVGPSICCNWAIGDVINAGFLSDFSQDLAQVAVQHYPANNCGLSGVIAPESIFPTYLNHTAATSFVYPYINASSQILGAGKPFVLLETNTASCGGFLGVSDSFGATLWTLDLALQLAAVNFSQVLLHNSGNDVYYNPISPPPGNETRTKGWNTGSTYYAMLAVAETFGSSNTSQILDLNSPSMYAPAYVIYEDGNPTRLALFNFVSDPTGANDVQFVWGVGGGETGQPGATPGSVSVRYLAAPSVSEKYNISWAGQIAGDGIAPQTSDGRLVGDVVTETVSCDSTSNTCTIHVPAPGFALVFLTTDALAASSPQAGLPISYSSTATSTGKASSVDPGTLQTSNGHTGMGSGGGVGSTSKETSGAGRQHQHPLPTWLLVVVTVVWVAMVR